MREAIADRDSALDAIGDKLAGARRSIEQRESEIEKLGKRLNTANARNDDVERVAARLSERVVERERELTQIRHQIAVAHERSDGAMRALASLAEELTVVRSQARGQATRIRLRALSDAIELSRQTSALDDDEPARARLVETLEATIAKLSQADDATELAEAEARRTDLRRPRHPADRFEGRIEVDVGPLTDFSQLLGFEDAAGAIDSASEIQVKRFASGRATLEMHLGEPVELLRELEAKAPFEFRVRDTRNDRVILDLSD